MLSMATRTDKQSPAQPVADEIYSAFVQSFMTIEGSARRSISSP
jgi:hypothetical protein